MNQYPTKWRPTLSLVVIGMLVFILSLPLGGIWIFRFYDDQLVRETENELIVQGAFVEAMFVAELKRRNFNPATLKHNITKKKQSNFSPIEPQLDLSAANILGPRSDAISTELQPSAVINSVGRSLLPTILNAQRTTLAGFRVLDENGIVVSGRSEVGKSLAHIPEVQKALDGEYASTIRRRISDSPNPPIYSISRGTGIRVFVAMPIAYEGKLIGVTYLSRTPSHFFRELYSQKWKLLAAALFMLVTTLLIAFVFVRTIKGPIDALNSRTKRISEGDPTAFAPLKRHGTSEIARLSEGLLGMAKKLQDRSDYIKTFAAHVSHELKSPLTSIKGAAELMREGNEKMKPEMQEKFLDNIIGDTDRLSHLLDRLRDHAEAEALVFRGECSISEVKNHLVDQFPELIIECHCDHDDKLTIPLETADIIFTNLAENSRQHNAKTFSLDFTKGNDEHIITASDDGDGISAANQPKIFDLFFTTKRDRGGTGMGLGIIRSVLDSHHASIELLESETGTQFQIHLPFREVYQ